MQVKKNGLKLMRDTASLTNALIENIGTEGGLKAGDTFAELMWTDRTLWVVTAAPKGENVKDFLAAQADTMMKDWTDGTEYPVRDEKGNIKYDPSSERYFVFRYRNWWCYPDTRMQKGTGKKVHLSFGQATGYRDPSF
jgi:hypothetical protein